MMTRPDANFVITLARFTTAALNTVNDDRVTLST